MSASTAFMNADPRPFMSRRMGLMLRKLTSGTWQFRSNRRIVPLFFGEEFRLNVSKYLSITSAARGISKLGNTNSGLIAITFSDERILTLGDRRMRSMAVADDIDTLDALTRAATDFRPPFNVSGAGRDSWSRNLGNANQVAITIPISS
jgi:hypothetical protein